MKENEIDEDWETDVKVDENRVIIGDKDDDDGGVVVIVVVVLRAED